MPVSVDDPYDDDVDSDASEGEAYVGLREEETVDGDASVLMAILMSAADHPETSEGGGIDGSSSAAASDPSWESSEDNVEDNYDDEDDEEENENVDDDSEDQEENYDDDFEDIDHDEEDQLDDDGEMDYYVDEERGCKWSASQSASSSYSTDSASSSSYSSSDASSADASDGSQKLGIGNRDCCPRKRCLWQTAVLVVVLAVPLGMVYRFYRSRHPSNGQDVSNRQSATSLPFLNMSSSSSAPPSPQPSAADSPTAAPVRSSSYVPTARTGSNHTSSGNHTSTSHGNATTMLCNGHANLCSIPANQVLFATLHNGHAAYDDGFTIFPNHQQSLEDAVNAGFRGINVDVGRCDNTIELTHTYCFLGTRDPVQVFTNLDAWLDDNPHEVLLMPVQIDNEAGGPVSMEEVWDVLTQSGNFVNKLYLHNDTMSSSSTTSSEYTYPTLRELIAKNQRVLFFIYNGEESCADLKTKKEEQEQATSTNWTTSSSSGSSSTGFVCPDGMYDWFLSDAAAETEYDFATIQDIQDASNSCRITRGNAVDASFFGVNVFLSIPTPETSSYLNSADFLGPHLESCMQMNNRTFVSAVMVDFWDRGNVLEVVHEYNSKR